jgi:hypothetical protein
LQKAVSRDLRTAQDELKLRKNLDNWHFRVEGEDANLCLSRFLTAFEELRARLAPSKYPNLEISDEGYLWFNIDSSIGIIEVMAFPFGYGDVKTPFVAVSVPRKAEDLELHTLEKLRNIQREIKDAQLFADKRCASKEEILAAYKRDEHSQLIFTSDFDDILLLRRKGVFFSYLGVRFSVAQKAVSGAEGTIRDIVLRLES